MNNPGLKCHFLNALFHIVHLAVIAFVSFAWLYPPLRVAHLALIVGTLACWFILGIWYGPGYCPISDWHWRLKAHLGTGKPEGSYIFQTLQYVTGKKLNSESVDLSVLIGTLLITVTSVILNVRAWMS